MMGQTQVIPKNAAAALISVSFISAFVLQHLCGLFLNLKMIMFLFHQVTLAKVIVILIATVRQAWYVETIIVNVILVGGHGTMTAATRKYVMGQTQVTLMVAAQALTSVSFIPAFVIGPS